MRELHRDEVPEHLMKYFEEVVPERDASAVTHPT